MEETNKIFKQIVDEKDFSSIDQSKIKEDFDFKEINSATSEQLENLSEFIKTLNEENRIDFIYEILCSPDIEEEKYQQSGNVHSFLNGFKKEIETITVKLDSEEAA